MALQKDWNFKGLLIPNAYHRISHISVFKKYPDPQNPEMVWDAKKEFLITEISSKYCIRFDVEISVAKGTPCVDTRSAILLESYTPFTGDSMSLAYNFLKTLPEYTGAIDA